MTGKAGERLYKVNLEINCSPSSTTWSNSAKVTISVKGTLAYRDSNVDSWVSSSDGSGSTQITFSNGINDISISSNNGYDITVGQKSTNNYPGFSTTVDIQVGSVTWNSAPSSDNFIYGSFGITLMLSKAIIQKGDLRKESPFPKKSELIFTVSVRKPE